MTLIALKRSIPLLLSFTLMDLLDAQPCRNFPKIIGGESGNTNINQIDVFIKGDALAFVTEDPEYAASCCLCNVKNEESTVFILDK